jgi:DNA-binding LytR/AlgR family response regulator
MSAYSLSGQRVLIVEDDYFMADELRVEFQRAGAEIVGPIGRVGEALEVVNSGEVLHGAVLDINLAGEMVFELAAVLREKNVPFVFTTGYDAEVIPEDYATVARYEKPVDPAAIARALFRH